MFDQLNCRGVGQALLGAGGWVKLDGKIGQLLETTDKIQHQSRQNDSEGGPTSEQSETAKQVKVKWVGGHCRQEALTTLEKATRNEWVRATVGTRHTLTLRALALSVSPTSPPQNDANVAAALASFTHC